MTHNHNQNIAEYNKPILIGIALNVLFIAIEIFYGLMSNSVALISDAGHNSSDVISLILALITSLLKII
ncbi:MAG: cation transporter [Ignavibacteria bacterium]